jgi:plastocyanin domain-containing protein
MRITFAVVCLLVCCARQRPNKTDAPQIFAVAVTSKGFEPPRIEVAPGQKVVLHITRKVAETCADAVDVQGDPVRHMLPLDAAVEVRATAPASGELAFVCPMQMIRGAIAVVGQ